MLWLHHQEERGSVPDTFCKPFSFLIQFCMLTSEMYFCMMSRDLLSCMSNPFASYKSKRKRYHLISLTVGLVSSVVLTLGRARKTSDDHSDGVVVTDITSGSPNSHAYGLMPFRMCWAKETQHGLTLNLYLLFLFYIPMVCVSGLRAVWQSARHTRHALPFGAVPLRFT